MAQCRRIPIACNSVKESCPRSRNSAIPPTIHQFRAEDPGTNYAQARYLCYYLQERGLLRKFHADFVKFQQADSGGYQTLKVFLKEKDMAAFQKRW